MAAIDLPRVAQRSCLCQFACQAIACQCVHKFGASRHDALHFGATPAFALSLKYVEQTYGFRGWQRRAGNRRFSFWAWYVAVGRVDMWRGSGRLGLSVAARFLWRCPRNLAVIPSPHPAHRTGRADFPHPALGQDFTPTPTPRCVLARSGVRDRSARKDARVDMSRPCVA